jgi:hypothetical protein
MKPRAFKNGVLGAILLACASDAFAGGPTRTFNIPATDAAKALDLFYKQAQIEALYSVDELRGIRTNAISGDVEISDALGRLLEGTGLEYSFTPDHAFMTVHPPEQAAAPARDIAKASAQLWDRDEEGRDRVTLAAEPAPICAASGPAQRSPWSMDAGSPLPADKTILSTFPASVGGSRAQRNCSRRRFSALWVGRNRGRRQRRRKNCVQRDDLLCTSLVRALCSVHRLHSSR